MMKPDFDAALINVIKAAHKNEDGWCSTKSIINEIARQTQYASTTVYQLIQMSDAVERIRGYVKVKD